MSRANRGLNFSQGKEDGIFFFLPARDNLISSFHILTRIKPLIISHVLRRRVRHHEGEKQTRGGREQARSSRPTHADGWQRRPGASSQIAAVMVSDGRPRHHGWRQLERRKKRGPASAALSRSCSREAPNRKLLVNFPGAIRSLSA